APERAVIERAAVVGRVFWWGAVSELSQPEERPSVIVQLQALARKELIRPDYADTAHEAPFRFTHILIQEAAYGLIPKARRAELLIQLAFALAETGDYERLQAVVDETAATATGAPDLEAYAAIVGLWLTLSWNPEGWVETAQEEAAKAISAFTAAGDDRGRP